MFERRLFLLTKRALWRVLLLMIAIQETLCLSDKRVSHFIRHFEPAFYDHVTLGHHHVTRRSTDQPISFTFNAFRRSFTPMLKANPRMMRSFQVETSNSLYNHTGTNAYIGHVKECSGKIHGIISPKGHFEGKIITGNETYYIESAHRYFNQSKSFPSFIYRQSDVIFNTSRLSCPHAQLREKQMRMTASMDKIENIDNVRQINRNIKEQRESGNSWQDRYKANWNTQFSSNSPKTRAKRAIDPDKKICELYLQADHLYYQRYNGDTETIINKLTEHVQAVDEIYRAVDFDGTNGADGVGFIIKKIKIWDDPSSPGYRYDGNFAVDYLLDTFSEDNYDAYCLSYLFTYRDFSDGVLGLAWVGDVNAAGGVCEIHRMYSGVGKSLNTGVVTILNYGTEVPAVVSYVTFAHEIGHNFGSNHDPDGDAQCTPGGSSGNYIMYARATDGTKVNNNKLSMCSIASINTVLSAKARDSDGCFIADTGQICGNRVVEGTEDCDCGWDTECTEGCCNPMVDNPGAPGVETPCTRKTTSVCSPSEGTCCTSNCAFHSYLQVCRNENDCKEQAYCKGDSAVCPASNDKTNATTCGNAGEFLVCYNGECTGSVCLAHGRQPCQCSASEWTDERLCHVCCLDLDGTCKSSYDLIDIPDAKVLAGTPCNNFNGYCDVFKKCRSVDPEGPLSNLKKLFLTDEGLTQVKHFLAKHWYIGIVIGVFLIVVIVLVVKFCSKSHKKHTDGRIRMKDSGPAQSAERKPKTNQILPDTYM